MEQMLSGDSGSRSSSSMSCFCCAWPLPRTTGCEGGSGIRGRFIWKVATEGEAGGAWPSAINGLDGAESEPLRPRSGHSTDLEERDQDGMGWDGRGRLATEAAISE
jgi:hypothetical protein